MEVPVPAGTPLRYTPDAIALRYDGQLVCMQCVESRYLDAAELARHSAIGSRLEALNVRFLVVTEAELDRPVTRRNARTLTQAQHIASTPARDAEDRVRLMRSKPASYAELEALLGAASSLRMLALGHVYLDMHTGMSQTSPLTYTLKEHLDAADFIHL